MLNAWVFLGLIRLSAVAQSESSATLPDIVVRLRDVDPSIQQDLRYASKNNFTGNPLAGYDHPVCWLTLPTAKALKRVQRRLKPFGLGLKVYDCYRPERATRALVAWAHHHGKDERAHEFLGAQIRKQEVFSRGYIAQNSAHSRASTVDIAIVNREASSALRARAPQAAQSVPTNACDLQGDIQDTGGLDFGTRFDCLAPRSHTRDASVAVSARAHRMLLWSLMRREGFVGYPKEWWHFRLFHEPFATSSFDVPIPP